MVLLNLLFNNNLKCCSTLVCALHNVGIAIYRVFIYSALFILFSNSMFYSIDPMVI